MKWDKILECHLAEAIMQKILVRIMLPRAKLGVGTWILNLKMDVKSAFRQDTVDLDGTSKFGVRPGGVVVDLRL